MGSLDGSSQVWAGASYPAQFVEELSAFLWSSQQLDAFRNAAIAYSDRLHKVIPPELPPAPRLGIAVIGKGVDQCEKPLFQKLRSYGTYFNRIRPENGLSTLLNAVTARARNFPAAYGHWYVDGGEAFAPYPEVTCVSYSAIEVVRVALSARIRAEIEKPGMLVNLLR